MHHTATDDVTSLFTLCVQENGRASWSCQHQISGENENSACQNARFSLLPASKS